MPWWVTLILTVASALAGYAASWFKIGPERKKLTVEAAEDAVTIHSSVLRDVHTSYTNLNDELVQVRMECLAIAQERDDLRKELQECRIAAMLNQEAIKEQRRLTLLARRHAHLARHSLGNYELHIDFLLEELRKRGIAITPIMRSQKLREAFQSEMEKLEVMEAALTEEAVLPESIDQRAEDIDE